MRILILTSLLISANALADCRCVARQNGRELFNHSALTIAECQEVIGDVIMTRFRSGLECQSSQAPVNIQWGCGTSPAPKTFTCAELQETREAEQLAAVTIGTTEILNIDFSLQPNVGCDEEHDHSVHGRALPAGASVIALTSNDEVMGAINDMGILPPAHTAASIARLIERESPVVFEIPRPAGGGGGGGSVKITFKKERDGLTSATVEHTAGAQSNIEITPRHKFQLTPVEAFYLEDRVNRVIVQSSNNGRAFFWRAEGGWHKIYGTNNGNGQVLDRTAEVLEFYNLPGRTHMPGYKPSSTVLYQGYQENRPRGFFLGGQVGVSLEEALSSRSAVSANLSVGVQADSLSNNSHVNITAGVQATVAQSNGVTVRVGAESTYRLFIDGTRNHTNRLYVEAGNGRTSCRAEIREGAGSAVNGSYFTQRSDRAGLVSCSVKW